MGKAVVSGCNSVEVRETPEHALDGTTIAVEPRGEAVLPSSVGLRRDVRRSAFARDLATGGVAVISLVAVQDFGAGYLIEQRIGGGAVGDLAAGQQECDGAAETIGQRVDFRRPPAAGAADRLREFPPLPPEAQR